MTMQRLTLDQAEVIRYYIRNHLDFELVVGRKVYGVDKEGFYSTPLRWIRGYQVGRRRLGRVVVAWPQLREEKGVL